MNLSVVIPAYNEEDNIRGVVEDVFNKFPDCELIVVNDASTDNTFNILSELRAEHENLVVLDNPTNKGHGFTVVRGLHDAIGEYVLYIDADRQIGLENIQQLNGYDAGMFDFVSGYRYQRKDKPFRKVISFCLKITILLRFGMYIKDSNCPFKLYRRAALEPLLSHLPSTDIVPIACLEVLARRYKLSTKIIKTPHQVYRGIRRGFLQSFNLKMYKFLFTAFVEVINL